MTTKSMVTLVALLCCGSIASRSTAGGTPVQKCAATKLKASGKKASGRFGCYSKAAAKSLPMVDQTCLDKATMAFDAGFVKADSKVQCEGTASSVETAIDNCINQVTTAITGNGKCQGAKLKASGKKAAAMLGCYAKAATTGALPAGCTDKASNSFSAAFTKADGSAPCPGDAPAVETEIDNNCVIAVEQQIPPQPVGCGNGIIDAGETCDDGNTTDCGSSPGICAAPPGDNCPSSCVIQACTPVSSSSFSVSVKFTAPSGTPVGGLGLFVDYPEGAVRLPASIFPSGVAGTPHDRDYGVSEDLVDSNGTGLPTSPNTLLQLTFKTCQGAATPTAADFKCTMQDAADESANTLDISTMSCTVTIP